MPIDGELWAGRRVLLTGHTGFKGAWLSLWLQELGARVTGLAAHRLASPSIYELARVADGMEAEHALDVRDLDALREAVLASEPQVIFHLAAQPLLRRGLQEPVGTFEVNVIGTANLLEAVREHPGGVEAVVVVTSDKCYANEGASRAPFVEGDPLGGKDPYSASKACAELVARAYWASYFESEGPNIATARAGNVIGGGDWAPDRLLADAVRVASGLAPAPLLLRNPDAVRPWQHVLNPLAGYLLLAQELVRDGAAGAWNFGPPIEDVRPVGWVIERLRALWSGELPVERDSSSQPPEAGWLALDSSKAMRELGWAPVWDLDAALRELVAWHQAHMQGMDMRAVSVEQLGRFAAQMEQLRGRR